MTLQNVAKQGLERLFMILFSLAVLVFPPIAGVKQRSLFLLLHFFRVLEELEEHLIVEVILVFFIIDWSQLLYAETQYIKNA